MKVPCGFGARGENGWCKFLVKKEGDKLETYVCSKYYEIIKDSTSSFSPAFGAGCCASLNSRRRDLLRQRRCYDNDGASG